MANTNLLWHTRQRNDSAFFANELAPFGIESIIAPVLTILPKPFTTRPHSMPEGLILTSRHAAHALAALEPSWRALPIYCVGNATAKAASAHGFTRVISGMRGVEALLARIGVEIAAGSTLLYFAGVETRADITGLLAPRGIGVRTLVVYDAIAEQTLSPEIIEALDMSTVRAVALFSPRTARITCELMEKARLAASARSITAYCFSPNVAEDASKLAWAAIHTCHAPTHAAMRELIISHHPKSE